MKTKSLTETFFLNGKIFTAIGLSVIIVSLMAWIAPDNYHHPTENDFIRWIKKRSAEANEKLPEDRVYLQFDKPFYNPGETIWFAAYIRNGQNLKPSAQSDILNVELIGPKGNVEKTIRLIAKNGKTAGDFTLGEETPGGIYKVKAYTNWQKNDSACFEHEITVHDFVLPALKMKLDFDRKAFGAGDEVSAKIKIETNENKPLSMHKIKYVVQLAGEKIIEQTAITDGIGQKTIKFFLPSKLQTNDGLLNIMIDYHGQTESVSRSIPIVLNKIQFSLFPEGGDLVCGIQSKVAFRALNEFGKPADIEGFVVNSKGKKVADFFSFHNGMGAFELTPTIGEKYFAKITKPEGIFEQYEIPKALERGYALSVEKQNKDEILLNINATETEELSLIAQVRGKICYATAVNVKPGINKLTLPATSFPMGVAQFTLFDSKGIERAERLAFLNKNMQLNISVSTDKEKYLPREKVTLTLSVKDERGMPLPANLSLSVVNDQLLAFADDKQSNILSKMLLEYDIKDKVEDPNFYFDPTEPKADKALDYLLMTSGWRRFSWEKVLNGDLPKVHYASEKAIISGIVYNGYTGMPVANAKLKTSDGREVETDAEGNFTLTKVDLTHAFSLTMRADGYYHQNQQVYDYGQNLIFYLYPENYYSHGKQYRLKPVKSKTGMLNTPPACGAARMQFDLIEAEIVPMEDRAVIEESAQRHFNKHDKLADKLKAKAAEAGTDLNDIKKERTVGEKKKSETVVLGLMEMRDIRARNVQDKGEENVEQATLYYRAKQFASPVYRQNEFPEQRTDFRSTIYWNPGVETDRSGKAEISFWNSDDISSFRIIVEGIGIDGSVGRSEKTYFTQMPFSMFVKVPTEVVSEDLVSIPITIKNNTSTSVTGLLSISAPKGLEPIFSPEKLQTLAAGKAKTIFLEYKVISQNSEGNFEIVFKACGMRDAFSKNLKVVPKGFPVNTSFSGNDMEAEYQINIRNVVKGSLRAKVTAFPSVVGDLLTGVDGILREPGGCFEQTSMSSYPNAMVMDYLKTTETKDEKLLAYAGGLLDYGYKRLITFETPQKGYEWFGKAPGHEGLTAYGLMQFNDLKKVYEGVDDKMVSRTAEWILSQKDGKGGFRRNSHALHNFGQISDDIMNGYIVYALAEAGYGYELKKEAEASYETAMKNKDPYQLAMNANALYKINDPRADKVMAELLKVQQKDGSFNGTTHSITYSTGQSLKIETTAIAILAMLKNPNVNRFNLNKAVEFIIKNRSGYGTFGNTQGTVLALKALTEFAKANKKTSEDGKLEFYVDGKKVAEKEYKAGEKNAVAIEGLEQYIKEGSCVLKVKFTGTKNPLPHAVVVSWNTSLPVSDEACKVDVKTKLSEKTVNQGETVRFSIMVKNKTGEALPSPIAIVGIPAGLSFQPWQLKELQEKNTFDYYEIIGNNLVLYYRGMAPNDERIINLDLKADIPGEYEAPASSAYLYYTNEYKTWTPGGKIVVKKQI